MSGPGPTACSPTSSAPSWLAGCRRLHRRYERNTDHFLAIAGTTAALICHHRPVRQSAPRSNGGQAPLHRCHRHPACSARERERLLAAHRRLRTAHVRPGAEQLAATLTSQLSAEPPATVNAFAEQLSWALYRLDRKEYGHDLSSDSFLHTRAAIVAAGRETYEATLHDRVFNDVSSAADLARDGTCSEPLARSGTLHSSGEEAYRVLHACAGGRRPGRESLRPGGHPS